LNEDVVLKLVTEDRALLRINKLNIDLAKLSFVVNDYVFYGA